MRRLFILRPEPGSTATVKRAREIGLDARPMPLFRIEPLRCRMPDAAGYDGILLTSANSVRCAGPAIDGLRLLPVYAVGDSTAAAARETGLKVAAVGNAGVQALLESLPSGLRLLHLCGVERASTDASRQEIAAVPVYRALPLPCPDISAELAGHVAAVHSSRAAQRLAELIPSTDRKGVRIAAISKAAADSAGSGWAMAEAAAQPNDDALLALAARLCESDAE